jgi:hypothetical protein
MKVRATVEFEGEDGSLEAVLTRVGLGERWKDVITTRGDDEDRAGLVSRHVRRVSHTVALYIREGLT